MKRITDSLRVIWCRVAYGHVMVKIGDVGNNKTLYMCARCLNTEALHTIN